MTGCYATGPLRHARSGDGGTAGPSFSCSAWQYSRPARGAWLQTAIPETQLRSVLSFVAARHPDAAPSPMQQLAALRTAWTHLTPGDPPAQASGDPAFVLG